MELQKQNSNVAAKSSVLFAALFRLVLLVGPEIVLIKLTSSNLLVCVLVATGYLMLWLSVDVGPFRAAGATQATKVMRPAPTAYARGLSKAQWVSHLFCKAAILFALFHSKLTI